MKASITDHLKVLLLVSLPAYLTCCKTPEDLTQVYKPQWEVKTSVSQSQMPVGVELTGVDDLPLPQDANATENVVERLSSASLPTGTDPFAASTPPPTLDSSSTPQPNLASIGSSPAEAQPYGSDPFLPNSGGPESRTVPMSTGRNMLPADVDLSNPPTPPSSDAQDPLLVSLVDPNAINPPLEPLQPKDAPVVAPQPPKPAPAKPAAAPAKSKRESKPAAAPAKLTTAAAATAAQASRVGNRRPAASTSATAADDAKAEIMALAREIERTRSKANVR